ncbi:uncharacterized protein FA14DRAFT_172461 [Meira miltonrushii]|uniref:Uncharacterized protein n=1 Tax=Meira miltonrushii TaxID=1280837 RepID=A0A316VE60_9BASI|nr:uncharacterized protein FA14DRAFT_172461 [Meira miltonrushii]PWN35862.1 hypothetical protein FA14DRAFT_172461 [Meira miltonrushii]
MLMIQFYLFIQESNLTFNMFFPSIFVAATYALMASGSAIPAEKRQTPATCSTHATGYLIVRPTDDSTTHSGPITYAGIVPNVKHTGIDGTSDSIIVTKNDDGGALQPQVWDFLQCTDQNGQSPPPGYSPQPGGPTANYFGILRPQNATQHCLALESENDATSGARNSILDSYCTQVPAQYRTFMFVDEIYGGSNDAVDLYFADQNTTLVISNTPHAELQFFTDGAPAGQRTYQLQLLPNTTP